MLIRMFPIAVDKIHFFDFSNLVIIVDFSCAHCWCLHYLRSSYVSIFDSCTVLNLFFSVFVLVSRYLFVSI